PRSVQSGRSCKGVNHQVPMALRRRLSWLLLASALLFDARCNSSSMCDGHCVIKAERVTPAGRIPFNNSQPLVTAVGLETTNCTGRPR
ncbi:MAG: hypothetical protein ACPIOQ_26040, partial [Promethearchaeia archaeon]